MGLATQPVISTNFGGGEHQRVHCTKNLAFFCVAAFGIVFFLAGLFLKRPLITLFMTGSPEVFAISDTAVLIYFTAFLFMGFNIVFTYYFQSTLQLKRAFACSLCRSVLFTGIFVFILPHAFGINGVWAALPAGEIAALILAIVLYILRREK